MPHRPGSIATGWCSALNDDLPYDEFVKRQLAVDLMPGRTPEERHALGFLGLSPTYFKELKLPPEIIKGTVADEWEEHVDAIGRTFLGLTLACARCHDHKSDPITAQDYYAIAGVFASVHITPVPAMADEIWAPVAKAREEVAKIEKERDELKKKKPAPEDLKAQVEDMEKKIAAIKEATPHYNVPMANGVEDAALYVVSAGEGQGTKLDFRRGQARDLELQKRGNPNQTGDVVKRRFLSAFPTKSGQPREFTQGSGRLELAEAILEDATPLAARVIVNRVWRHHFGRGLVATPSEFGTLGDPPTHPELLDDLTARFIAHGWSLKWLHREILLSAAWQQDSVAPKSEQADPENRLIGRPTWPETASVVALTARLYLGGAGTPGPVLRLGAGRAPRGARRAAGPRFAAAQRAGTDRLEPPPGELAPPWSCPAVKRVSCRPGWVRPAEAVTRWRPRRPVAI